MTETEHPNVTAVRQGFQAFESGDMQWMDEHIAEDVVWHVGGKSKMSGSYRGKEEVLNLFAKQAEMMGSGPRLDVHEVVGNDEHVIAIGSASLDDPDGGTVEWKWANVFHVKDGIAHEVWELADDSSAFDALVDKRM
ncbi:MAG: nuclear transport factor 2 family protein [Actinobacteria bacterium]|nr:nuclear transport factor 2 family protein [Actinomycetota bacterium]